MDLYAHAYDRRQPTSWRKLAPGQEHRGVVREGATTTGMCLCAHPLTKLVDSSLGIARCDNSTLLQVNIHGTFATTVKFKAICVSTVSSNSVSSIQAT